MTDLPDHVPDRPVSEAGGWVASRGSTPGGPRFQRTRRSTTNTLHQQLRESAQGGPKGNDSRNGTMSPAGFASMNYLIKKHTLRIDTSQSSVINVSSMLPGDQGAALLRSPQGRKARKSACSVGR
jgi:hypothetical protein